MPNKYQYDIHNRIYSFVIRVLALLRKIRPDSINAPILNQVVRSVTSMGANDREADGSLTRNDFVHNYVTVRKEGKETVYWLELLRDLNPNIQIEANLLTTEGQEIVKIVSSIIQNSRRNST